MICKQALDLTSTLRGSAPSTQQIYKRRAQQFLLTMGQIDSIDLTHIDGLWLSTVLNRAAVTEWLVGLQQHQPMLGKSALDLARSAIVFLARIAAEQHIVDDDTYLSIQSIQPLSAESGQHPGTWLMLEEIARLIEVLDTPGIWQPIYQMRNRALIQLMLFCGIRAGEAAAARWGDLIRQGSHNMLRVHGKGKKVGYIKVPPEVYAALVDWRRQHPAAANDAFIFVNAHHRSRHLRPLTTASIWKTVQTAGQAAHVTTLSPHDLRRTFARMVYEAGASYELIRQTLRHEQVAMTEHYVNAQVEFEQTAADFLAEFLQV